MSDYSDKERLVYAVSTHWMKYLPQALFCHFLLIIGIGILLVSYWTVSFSPILSMGLAVMGGFIFLIAHHKWFHKLMSEEFIDIVLTTERIIYFDDFLFFEDNEHEIPLHRVAGIEVLQEGLLSNLLDYGSLWIDTGGGVIDFKRCIPYVPRPEVLNDEILSLDRKTTRTTQS